jgi:hypothetical protein
MIFKVLMAVNMKMTAFWNKAPCNVVEVDDVSEVSIASNIKALT